MIRASTPLARYRGPAIPRALATATILFVAVAVLSGCGGGDTSKPGPELEQRLATEGVVRRGDNFEFRRTQEAGEPGGSWREGVASIVVTKQSVIVHRGGDIGLEIKPTSRRFYEVERDGGRVRIRAGSGKSREVWSFIPPDDAEGWTHDIRAVVRASDSVANP